MWNNQPGTFTPSPRQSALPRSSQGRRADPDPCSARRVLCGEEKEDHCLVKGHRLKTGRFSRSSKGAKVQQGSHPGVSPAWVRDGAQGFGRRGVSKLWGCRVPSLPPSLLPSRGGHPSSPSPLQPGAPLSSREGFVPSAEGSSLHPGVPPVWGSSLQGGGHPPQCVCAGCVCVCPPHQFRGSRPSRPGVPPRVCRRPRRCHLLSGRRPRPARGGRR